MEGYVKDNTLAKFERMPSEGPKANDVTMVSVLCALTSILSGFLGMRVAKYANAKITLAPTKGTGKAYITASILGAVMGFLLIASGLMGLYNSINLFGIYYRDDWEGLYGSITGYVLEQLQLHSLDELEEEYTGLIIGYTTEYYTSNACSPVQDIAASCRTGVATNVICGLALGSKSVIIPIFAIAVAIYVNFSLSAIYGLSVAVLGMLSTMAIGLALDVYGPISDDAGGIAEMAGMRHKIRERTDALDAAGQWFSAIVGLIVGAMLPYWFSAMTMRSVGSVALTMVEEVWRQFNTIPRLMEGKAKPNYATCVKISPDASLKEMIPPGALSGFDEHLQILELFDLDIFTAAYTPVMNIQSILHQFTLVGLLTACSNLSALNYGRLITRIAVAFQKQRISLKFLLGC
ncbi:pyrophosphate-energized vacuolar membrane proton pump-like [Aristolochia californica]|uniref:pyrophosphate-energized vacuolar membrane proton pump-like n=1 Tax=Aristolochia californica TaxID=171875 RepID=UPI0035D6D435